MQQYRVNFGLLIGLIVGTLVVSAATYGLHQFQINRNADTLIAAGEKGAEGRRLSKPPSASTRTISRFAPTTTRSASSWPICGPTSPSNPKSIRKTWVGPFAIWKTSCGRCPEEKALQKRLVDLYGRIGQLQQALDHLARDGGKVSRRRRVAGRAGRTICCGRGSSTAPMGPWPSARN